MEEKEEFLEKKLSEQFTKMVNTITKGINGNDSIKGILNRYLEKFDEVQNCAQTFIPVADQIERSNIVLNKR